MNKTYYVCKYTPVELLESLGDYGKYGAWIMLGIANLMFLCYDYTMCTFRILYQRHLKPRIFPKR